jgi:hypothetical protein
LVKLPNPLWDKALRGYFGQQFFLAKEKP